LLHKIVQLGLRGKPAGPEQAPSRAGSVLEIAVTRYFVSDGGLPAEGGVA